jgi:hypothetical protein
MSSRVSVNGGQATLMVPHSFLQTGKGKDLLREFNYFKMEHVSGSQIRTLFECQISLLFSSFQNAEENRITVISGPGFCKGSPGFDFISSSLEDLISRISSGVFSGNGRVQKLAKHRKTELFKFLENKFASIPDDENDIKGKKDSEYALEFIQMYEGVMDFTKDKPETLQEFNCRHLFSAELLISELIKPELESPGKEFESIYAQLSDSIGEELAVTHRESLIASMLSPKKAEGSKKSKKSKFKNKPKDIQKKPSELFTGSTNSTSSGSTSNEERSISASTSPSISSQGSSGSLEGGKGEGISKTKSDVVDEFSFGIGSKDTLESLSKASSEGYYDMWNGPDFFKACFGTSKN